MGIAPQTIHDRFRQDADRPRQTWALEMACRGDHGSGCRSAHGDAAGFRRPCFHDEALRIFRHPGTVDARTLERHSWRCGVQKSPRQYDPDVARRRRRFSHHVVAGGIFFSSHEIQRQGPILPRGYPSRFRVCCLASVSCMFSWSFPSFARSTAQSGSWSSPLSSPI